MQREKLNNKNKSGKEKKEGYIIVPNYFLKKWVKVLGVGPIVLYEELLTYCHKGKYIAWPTLDSLCQEMGIAKTTLLRYQNTLIKFGLVKNISRAKSTTGHYRNNVYQITPFEKVPGYRDIRYQNDTDIGSKMKPDRYQNDTCIGSKMILSLVSKRYPNNSNLNITNLTAATKREKDAVVAVDFKKLKEKGEEKMQAIREQLGDLDFKEEFIEKILKEYSVEKIEENLDLLMERRNIQNPAGWLRAALKNDYPTPHPHLNPPPSKGEETIRIDSRFHGNDRKGNGNDRKGNGNDIIPNVIANDRRECGNPKQVNLNSLLPSPLEGEGLPCVVEKITAQGKGEGDKILSTEETRKRFHSLREQLMAMKSP